MSSPIIKTSDELNQAKQLLSKSVPMHRKAYSDRTAWLMACFAELAYMRFNPPVITERLGNQVESMLSKGKKSDGVLKSAIQLAVDKFAYNHDEEKKLLDAQLGQLDAELIKTFDADGSQAILIKTNEFVVLSFRGTEPTELKDIKSDADAVLTNCVTEGKVHSGFHNAYNIIEMEVNQSLKEFGELPIFITGHSLGGALATIAAKRITHLGGNAACYTFGAPRVSDDHWLMTMKTPIYRVVNSSDGVTMVPPPDFLITSISWVLGFIPAVGDKLKSALREKFGEYIHGGDMRFLTNVKAGEYSKARLLTHVDIWYRLKGWARKQLTWKKFGTDHSMSVYRAKLAFIALKRN
ncbi:lipase (class 3) [Idiomarina loihiensis]|uniref:lipase family protein n=1 Tax=Idiomarina TaxID=135575 RepID=UPI000D708ED9|nr:MULTISPECIES: lipase family protein [Idiomarina]PWW38512.1 lipase (class 3) [Idiomarina loihiensis]TDP48414.1 lipase (class 3) [Idiomarina loihiensis]TDS23580.1 lipase (class 3) [Idiomarina sp. H2]